MRHKTGVNLQADSGQPDANRVSRDGKVVRLPWMMTLVDAYSRTILATYVSIQPCWNAVLTTTLRPLKRRKTT